MTAYIESPADHDFTAFLANLTPGRVLRDREPITTIERKRLRFMVQRRQVAEAVALARDTRFPQWQMDAAHRAAERQEKL